MCCILLMLDDVTKDVFAETKTIGKITKML